MQYPWIHVVIFSLFFNPAVLSGSRSQLAQHAACFENVQERMGEDGGGLSNSESQRGHRNNTQSQSGSHGDKCGSLQWGWESDERERERERGKGQGKSGRRVCWRQGWRVLGELVGAALLKRTVGSMMVLYCISTRTFFHPSSQIFPLSFQLREYPMI